MKLSSIFNLKKDLVCIDVKGRTWLVEHVTLLNFWHKWLYNRFPSTYRYASGDGIFQPKTVPGSFKWR